MVLILHCLESLTKWTQTLNDKRKRPKLKPMRLTDKDLDEMSIVTDQDVIEAGAEWREHAKADELIEASPQVEEADNGNGS